MGAGAVGPIGRVAGLAMFAQRPAYNGEELASLRVRRRARPYSICARRTITSYAATTPTTRRKRCQNLTLRKGVFLSKPLHRRPVERRNRESHFSQRAAARGFR